MSLFQVTSKREKAKTMEFDEGYLERIRKNMIREACISFYPCTFIIHFMNNEHQSKEFRVDIQNSLNKEQVVNHVNHQFVEYCLSNHYPLNGIELVECEPLIQF